MTARLHLVRRERMPWPEVRAVVERRTRAHLSRRRPGLLRVALACLLALGALLAAWWGGQR